MSLRRYTFRLYPSAQQEKLLLNDRRLHAYLYNACVSQRQTEYKYNKKSVSYFEQQNTLLAFKEDWTEYKNIHSQALQATIKRVDFAYQRFFQGLGEKPKFKSIRNYSGWTYPGSSGWKAITTGKNGFLILNQLSIKIQMRGKAKHWGTPTTLTIVYKPNKKQWYASFTVDVDIATNYGSASDLSYDKLVSYDLGLTKAITLYDGKEYTKIENPRFTQKTEKKIKRAGKDKRRKRNPQKGVKASKRWKKANKKESKLKSKAGHQRKDWQHKVTSEIASRYDIGVTEKLNTKGMTKKGKRKQKAGLNKSILSVGFGEINKMINYKIEQKGGIVMYLNTQKLKPSQRCPKCYSVNKHWKDLGTRYHVCDHCDFQMERDNGSCFLMYNVATGQPWLGTNLDSLGCLSATSKTRVHTGSMKQLGQKKRQKSQLKKEQVSHTETPSFYKAG